MFGPATTGPVTSAVGWAGGLPAARGHVGLWRVSDAMLAADGPFYLVALSTGVAAGLGLRRRPRRAAAALAGGRVEACAADPVLALWLEDTARTAPAAALPRRLVDGRRHPVSSTPAPVTSGDPSV